MIVLHSSTEKRITDFGVSRESIGKLKLYVNILTNWQTKINLIGNSTVDGVWERHILDSVQLLPLLPAHTRIIAELGSGAGIPGLVISIAGGFEPHLYESNIKKCAFLREAARVVGVNAHIHNVRMERLGAHVPVPTVDCVVARAVAPLSLLLEYAEPFLAKGATALFQKGQDVDSELTEATKYWKMEIEKHPSATESNGVILAVKEAKHV
jgi:16S rRNA (guanine527-N7)-methyltransferase